MQGEFSGNIHLLNSQEDLLRLFRESSAAYSKIAILTDENTRDHCLPLLGNVPGTNISIPAGEENKNIGSAKKIWGELLAAGFDINSLLINMGGGMITDLGGFAASVFKRGIDFIHVPTSLTAQIDAAIGGKTGINFEEVKNQVGTFAWPDKVMVFPDFLKSLPHRELKSGFAEAMKHAIISDPAYWEFLKTFDLTTANTEFLNLIDKSIQIKMEIVEKDPMEKKERKMLNFGHSIGHAIESFLQPGLLHGEAVAAGMICEAYISSKILDFPLSALEDIVCQVNKRFHKVSWENHQTDRIINKVYHDKKNKNGKLLFSLIEDIGSCIVEQEVGIDLIHESFRFYQNKGSC